MGAVSRRMATRVVASIARENEKAAERRHKLDLQKIIFVTTSLGAGAAEFGSKVDLSPALYVAPLVAIFFDMMVLGQHFVIKRNNAFLRCAALDPIEAKYRVFLSAHRDRVFRYGSRGFTIVAIAASGIMYWSENPLHRRFAAIWFGSSMLGYFLLLVTSYRSQHALDRLGAL